MSGIPKPGKLFFLYFFESLLNIKNLDLNLGGLLITNHPDLDSRQWSFGLVPGTEVFRVTDFVNFLKV